jgi:hypothetical protein
LALGPLLLSNYPIHTKGNIMTTFDEMTNAELKEACEDFDIEVKAKNPAKPNKAEYLEALGEFKAKQDATHGVTEESRAEEAKAEKESTAAKNKDGKLTKAVPKKKQTPSQLQKLELFRKDRVMIRDMQENQTKDELVSVSWGNRRIGRQTDWVDVSGNAQYVRKGAINNLKEASMIVHESKPGGGDAMKRKDRFVIVDVDGMSDKEIAELAAQQKMRNSKSA